MSKLQCNRRIFFVEVGDLSPEAINEFIRNIRKRYE